MEKELKKKEIKEKKGNDIKTKNIEFLSNKAKNELLNLISYLLVNKNTFKEKIKASELGLKLDTYSNMSYINKLIYTLIIDYKSFNIKRDIVENIKTYKEFPDKININDEYYSLNSIFPLTYLHFFPVIQKGINLDLSFFPIYSYNKANKKINKYNFYNTNNIDNKYILCFYIFKNDENAINELDIIIDNLKLTQKFWDFFKNIYVFFQIKSAEQIKMLVLNPKINKYTYNDNTDENNNKKIIYLFNILKSYEKSDSVINIFHDKKNASKDYFFILDQDNKIIKLKNISFISDTIYYFLFNLKNNILYNPKEKIINKQKRLDKMVELMNFILKLKHLDYFFDVNFGLSINISINDDLSEIKLTKINSIEMSGKFCTKEYKYLKKIFNSIRQKNCIFNIKEIPTIDIEIDFTNMECHKCSKKIPEDNFLYYCFICKNKYCVECVKKNLKNKGMEKYIDNKHNLLFFKTRDKSQFLNIDKSKIGNNKFTESIDDNDFDNKHDCECSGCHINLQDTERYICLKCKKGLILGNGFIDYCGKCIDAMCNNKEDMEKLEKEANDIIKNSNQNKFTEDHKVTIRHKHENHIYLMLPLQYRHEEDPYYNF